MYQEHSISERESLKNHSMAIKSLIDLGIDFYREEERNGISNKNLASLLLFHQILEMGDAIGEMIKIGCVNASKPLLRTLLECYSQLKFLLSKDEERKALQILYQNEITRKRHYENLAYPNKVGSFQERIKNDRLLKEIDIIGEEKSKYISLIQEIDKTLNDQIYNEIREEYYRLEKKSKNSGQKTRRVKYWYELFDGPKNLQGLLIEIKEPALYEFVYRYCSSYSHGEDIVYPKLKENKERSISIIGIRGISELSIISSYSIMLLEMSCGLLLKRKITEKKKFAKMLIENRLSRVL